MQKPRDRVAGLLHMWSSLAQVKTSLIEMDCPNFLKIVDLW
jgi:hypothetical protein